VAYSIVVEGVIGVGKTTLARYLQQELDAKLILERFEENPFLSDFYADRAAFAFQTQIFFLLSRYQQQQTIANLSPPIVTDYLFAKDHIFAQLNLEGDELATYEGVYRALADKIPTPDLVIYLKATPPTLMRRIALRDRPYERDMDQGYISNLSDAYDNFFASYDESPLLTIDADDIDFVEFEDDRRELIGQIRTTLEANGPRHTTHPSPQPTRSPHPKQPYDPQHTPLDQSSRRLSDFQQFHRFLDEEKGFNTDILFNMLALQEEFGELSSAVRHYWVGLQKGTQDVALDALQGELADVLAYLLKVANYTGIDLEAAYLEKMARNRSRSWDTPEGNV
jgi:deoxyadenosine/deoxycytidine kinase/NTP pyrophosphatase (non-canonical NTP hydrolase)